MNYLGLDFYTMYDTILHSNNRYLRIVFMGPDIPYKSAEYLEASINKLSDEHQRHFLGVLEALTYAQNMAEKPAEPEAIKDDKQSRN